MAAPGRSEAIIETSVLVNFLKIGRTDLLGKHPIYRFVVPDLVRDEVTRHYPVQVARLDAAIAAGELLPDQPAASTALAALAAFAAMSTLRIGDGERAAIAAAATRGFPLAMDDQRAWKRSAPFSATLHREDTVSLVVSLIKGGVLSVAEADTIKADWQANHRFKLAFRSFAEKI
jgi:predicted nucleic acid-binding protein